MSNWAERLLGVIDRAEVPTWRSWRTKSESRRSSNSKADRLDHDVGMTPGAGKGV